MWVWAASGGGLALLALLGILRPPRLRRMLWTLDRGFALHEQISTAWQVLRGGRQDEIAASLVEDAAKALPGATGRVFFHGWNLLRDLEAGLITVILGGMVAFGMIQTGYQVPNYTLAPLPPLQREPTLEEVFPSGLPALESMLRDAQTEGGLPKSLAAAATSNENAEAAAALGDIFQENPLTQDLGDALQNGDLESAARALETLAGQMDTLSEEQAQDLAETLEQAGNQAGALGAQDLAGALQNAAENAGSAPEQAAQNLEQIAAQIREAEAQQAAGQEDPINALLDAAMGDQAGEGQTQEAGTGAGAGDQPATAARGEPEPVIRLEGANEVVELNAQNDQSGLLRPGSPLQKTEDDSRIAEGAYDVLTLGDEEVISTVLTPYYYAWKWTDVVSNYFAPEP